MSYQSLAVTAKKLLVKFGQGVTRRAYGTSLYDTSTGTNTVTYTDSKRYGAVLDFGKGVLHVNGTQIAVGDKRLLLDAAGDRPEMTDHYFINGDEYAVISVGEVNPAGTPVIYDLHIRK